jgi:hypothetical protein
MQDGTLAATRQHLLRMPQLQAAAVLVVSLQAPALKGSLLSTLPLPRRHCSREGGQAIPLQRNVSAPRAESRCLSAALRPHSHALQQLPARTAGSGVGLPSAQQAALAPALHVQARCLHQGLALHMLLPLQGHHVLPGCKQGRTIRAVRSQGAE